MRYKTVIRDGIAAIVVHRGRVLLLKRFPVPLIANPGIWSFVFGGRRKGEGYLDAAYREIREETGIDRNDLTQVGHGTPVWIFDRWRRCRWQNHLFIFRSNTGRVRKNFENTACRWAALGEIRGNTDYTNVFIDEDAILRKIARCTG